MSKSKNTTKKEHRRGHYKAAQQRKTNTKKTQEWSGDANLARTYAADAARLGLAANAIPEHLKPHAKDLLKFFGQQTSPESGSARKHVIYNGWIYELKDHSTCTGVSRVPKPLKEKYQGATDKTAILKILQSIANEA
ncbi:hypothetical protein FWH09_01535 [Candidatus Saccharibacteria bacterium]|nr:hypothetical protein [Candidatus Saccharibacteria bacterium]